MGMASGRLERLHAALLCSVMMSVSPAAARGSDAAPALQEAGAQEPAEIVVTARQRAETALTVPVAVTAVSGETIERQAASDISSIASLVPGLLVAPAPNPAGGTIALRGIASPSTNGLQDQAVAINIDGIQVSHATVLRTGLIDVASVEVLRGPQALFFGKNSPGGVISLRSADPKREFEASLLAGYEFYARSKYVEGMVSGPIADNVLLRVVTRYADTDGYFKVRGATVPGVSLTPADDRAPGSKEWFTRATLLINPDGPLSVRLKGSYFNSKGTGGGRIGQRIYCRSGVPQALVPIDDCKQDRIVYDGDLVPSQVAAAPQYGNGRPFGDTDQVVVSAEINYKLAPNINVTSLTGYYYLDDIFFSPFSYEPAVRSASLSATNVGQFTQEFRLSTDFGGVFDVFGGAFFQDSNIWTYSQPLFVTFFPRNRLTQDGKTYSAYGQLLVRPISMLELAGGARWTRERKRLAVSANGVPYTNLVRTEVEFDNVSPEATVTWRPTSNLTAYLAYKRGFKSGGFDGGVTPLLPQPPAPPITRDYRPEKAQGWEAGIKGRLPGGARGSLVAYSYRYDDLQVTFFDPTINVQRILNASSARVKGVELDVGVRPRSVPGLEVHGSVYLNDATFIDFQNVCYSGQSIAAGCVGLQQRFAGRRLANAPLWSGSLGGSYEKQLSQSAKLTVGADAFYTDAYNPMQEQAPGARQQQSIRLDLNAELELGNRWSFGVIGRNLTNVFRAYRATSVPLTGSATGTAAAVPADLIGNLNFGREVRVQLKFKY
ncbi:TonB-dependent receptor (plasmid) [Sphingobium sp. JS3065]|uniref:TonB-dependent receptor n=1 Tax=Sphingobium sp. JS3065 TaxID=2970925 RepID=UPI0022646273|nr:TonB-dependent receptor [Sphingobium sp. JS3065]UZW58294.1 TonB-dependent receptor [Sphingobium sp. JS3065]